MTTPPPAAPSIVDRPDSGRYEALVEGVVAGTLDYRRSPGRVLLIHTEVLPAYEGRGIGSALARRSFDDARAEARTIIVTCPFLASWLERHPDDAEGVRVRV